MSKPKMKANPEYLTAQKVVTSGGKKVHIQARLLEKAQRDLVAAQNKVEQMESAYNDAISAVESASYDLQSIPKNIEVED